MRAAVIATILACSTVAFAQPPGLTPPSSAPANATLTLDARPLTAKPLRAPKQRGTAYLASVGGMLVPFVILLGVGNSQEPEKLVLAAGVTGILMPSGGHWYAGKFFTTGMGIRLLGGGIATLSLLVLVNADDSAGSAEGAFWLGALAVGIGAVYDLATAGAAVDTWNREHATAVTPTAMKIGSDGYGLGVVGRF